MTITKFVAVKQQVILKRLIQDCVENTFRYINVVLLKSLDIQGYNPKGLTFDRSIGTSR